MSDRFVATSLDGETNWNIMDTADLQNMKFVNPQPMLYKYDAEYAAKELNRRVDALLKKDAEQLPMRYLVWYGDVPSTFTTIYLVAVGEGNQCHEAQTYQESEIEGFWHAYEEEVRAHEDDDDAHVFAYRVRVPSNQTDDTIVSQMISNQLYLWYIHDLQTLQGEARSMAMIEVQSVRPFADRVSLMNTAAHGMTLGKLVAPSQAQEAVRYLTPMFWPLAKMSSYTTIYETRGGGSGTEHIMRLYFPYSEDILLRMILAFQDWITGYALPGAGLQGFDNSGFQDRLHVFGIWPDDAPQDVPNGAIMMHQYKKAAEEFLDYPFMHLAIFVDYEERHQAFLEALETLVKWRNHGGG